MLLDAAPPSTPLPLLAKGFRPFFLLAALCSVLTVVLWLGVLRGVVAPPGYLDPVTWHAHEMLLGFSTAVVAGFLLTAVGNWTQRETATGAWLAALALLWLSGRLALWFGGELPRGVPAIIDLAFVPALAWTLARPLIAAKSWRNFVMLAIVAGLFAGNLAVHAEALGLLGRGASQRASRISVDLLVLLMSVIAGRVIPMFTRNATGVAAIRSNQALDVATNAALFALVIVDVAALDVPVASSLAGLAGVLAAARALRWGARYTRREPLLWILHAGYGWLVVGLLLRAHGGLVGAATASSATHAITAGAVGSLTLGMMARVSLGHTGRMLAAPRPMGLAFLLITLAAVSRVVAPLYPALYVSMLSVAAVCWSLAFSLFLFCYLPVLIQPRVDGRPG